MLALQRPGPVREPRPPLLRAAVAALVAALLTGMLTVTGLVAGASPASAADTDLVHVPDPEWRAVLNKAIATSRAPDAPITVADAKKPTRLSNSDRRTITDFTGVEAFVNVTLVGVTGKPASEGTPSSAGDLTPWAALTKVTSFQLHNFPAVTDLTPLASMLSLRTLNTTGLGVSDPAPITSLPQLTTLTLADAKVSDLSTLAGLKTAPQFTNLQLQGNRVVDLGPLTGFKSLTNLNLDRNRVEDLSVVSTFDSSYALCGGSGSLSVAGNHIRDLSVTCQGVPTAPTIPSTVGQTVYAGAYPTGGVTVGLKARAGYTPRVADPAVGSYDPVTGVLTSVDPSAPLLPVIEHRSLDFSDTWTVYFSEDPAKLADLRINEVESDGDARGDWVELYNPSATPVDLSGVIVSDDDNAHRLTFQTGTTIPGKGYRALVTNDTTVTGNFGLGGDDDARIFAPGTTDLATATPIDAHAWTTHATATYGRTTPGAGRWETTRTGTFQAENLFPLPTSVPTVAVTGTATSTTGSATLTATVTKPAGEAATDATGDVVFAVGGVDRSGPVAVSNGVATWTVTNLTGSPTGTGHEVTARYVSAGGGTDPYSDSVASAPFRVTVTILAFVGNVTLSSTAPEMCGEPLAVQTSGISPAPDSLSYLWEYKSQSQGESGWKPILPRFGDQGGPTLTLKFWDPDNTIGEIAEPRFNFRVRVTAVKSGYATTDFASAATELPTRAKYVSKPAAVLSTTFPKVGETITATHPEWAQCGVAEFNYRSGYDYQWLRDGEPIEGATDRVEQGIGGAGPKQVSYTVTPADVGHRLALRVVGSSLTSIRETVDSSATTAVAAAAFATAPAPVIGNASPKLGDTLTASTAAWSPVAEHGYQWLRDGAPIAGATRMSYTTVAADVDHAISVRVTGTAEGYEATERTSTATAKVAAGTFTQTPAPVVDNTAPTFGVTLTASVAAWSPVAQHAFQWLRDGQPIAGATGATYATTAADVGHAISVRATGTAVGYTAVQQTSAATAAVKPRTVQAPATVKATAAKGRKVKISVTVEGLAPAALPRAVTVKVAGARGAYTVKLKNGVGTLALQGAKAKKVKTGKKAKVTVTVKPFSATTGATTYVVAATTKAVQVSVKK